MNFSYLKDKISVFQTLVLFAAVLFVSAACSQIPRSDPQIVAEPNRVDLRLAEAADRVTRAVEALAEVEQARNPAPIAQRLDDVPAELKRTVTISWIGPVAPLAQKIADRANYNFVELGDQPPVPIVVNVDVVNTPLIDVLRNIGLQMNGRGSVVVDGSQRVVEVNYAPAFQ